MNQILTRFIDRVIESSNYDDLDRYYLINRVLALVGEEQIENSLVTDASDLIDLKDQLVELAVQSGQIEADPGSCERLGAQLMNFITPPPSIVNKNFWNQYQLNGSEAALAYFYHLSQANDYIKMKAIQKNIYFQTASKYGHLEITINLSKPEKDPKEIARAKTSKRSVYIPCQLCVENEGFIGRNNYPARTNHRIIRFMLGDEKWGFQYSPYAYFDEHCIFLSERHQPMAINRETFVRLLAIIDKFPQYFVGSNADLPIVGGSILSHEHYQGGRHDFPMGKAPIEQPLHFKHFNTVEAGIVKWPMSVIRLRCSEIAPLIELADKILKDWRRYSDARVNIRAESNGEPHHTITPIARRSGSLFEMDLVLRDNQTSSDYPDGIFHPHKDVQHIKKENIGLIEVMGLAIFPPRLKKELHEVASYLLGKENQIKDYHRSWADAILVHHSELSQANVNEIIKHELGKVFERVLEDAGVFKRTENGRQAFDRFIQFVNNGGEGRETVKRSFRQV